jgi:hypothetical protein
MPTFYLQDGNTDSSVHDYKDNSRTLLPDPRTFIDNHQHRNAKTVMTIEADDWIDARGQVGNL